MAQTRVCGQSTVGPRKNSPIKFGAASFFRGGFFRTKTPLRRVGFCWRTAVPGLSVAPPEGPPQHCNCRRQNGSAAAGLTRALLQGCSPAGGWTPLTSRCRGISFVLSAGAWRGCPFAGFRAKKNRPRGCPVYEPGMPLEKGSFHGRPIGTVPVCRITLGRRPKPPRKALPTRDGGRCPGRRKTILGRGDPHIVAAPLGEKESSASTPRARVVLRRRRLILKPTARFCLPFSPRTSTVGRPNPLPSWFSTFPAHHLSPTSLFVPAAGRARSSVGRNPARGGARF